MPRAEGTRAVDDTVSALSERVERSLREVRRSLNRFEGRQPALVRDTFDAGLELEIWTATDEGAATPGEPI